METENNKSDTDKKEDASPDIPPIEEVQSNNQRSRLYKVKESQLKRNILLTIGAVFLLGLVMFFAGPAILVQFSVLLDKVKNNDAQQIVSEEEQAYIPPPLLKKPLKATKEASITISGEAEKKQTIELYVNNSLVNKASTGNASVFHFDKVSLREGENMIRTRAVAGKTKSAFSNAVKVIYREKAPDLEITNPHEGDAFTGDQTTLKVTGKTASHAKVTVNDAWAVMDDEGNFQYTYIMQSGENKLKIAATDEAGNKNEKEIKFNYSP